MSKVSFSGSISFETELLRFFNKKRIVKEHGKVIISKINFLNVNYLLKERLMLEDFRIKSVCLFKSG